jgi:creatinine amidohydrolase/Fe(II)-dependent formamide hydrolase-like protein
MAVHPALAVPREAWPAYRGVAHDPLHDLGGDRHEDAARHAARFPDGPIASDPAMATAEDGERLLDAAAEDVAETFAAFEAAPDHSAR